MLDRGRPIDLGIDLGAERIELARADRYIQGDGVQARVPHLGRARNRSSPAVRGHDRIWWQRPIVGPAEQLAPRRGYPSRNCLLRSFFSRWQSDWIVGVQW